MKKLSEILHEAPQGITESIVVPSYILSTLKTLGFKPAEPGPKTYRILSGPNKIEALYGIPMRAGYWADVFFAILDNEKAPYCVVDRDGRDCYKDSGDAIKALQKRMHTITEETYTNYGDFSKQHKKMYPSHSEEQIKAAWEKYKKMTHTAQVRQMNKDDRANRAAAWGKVFSNLRKEEVEGDEEEEIDLSGESLSQLEDICEMADELYETLSEVEEIDSETRDAIAKIYSELDDLYAAADGKYDIAVDSDEYEEPMSEEVDMNRFRILANTGLVADDEVQRLVLAFKALEAGRALGQSQKDIITSTFQTLVSIVTGDTSILTKVKRALPKS